jgi:Tol biopolymer transport system component
MLLCLLSAAGASAQESPAGGPPGPRFANPSRQPFGKIDALAGTARYDPRFRFRTVSTARFDIYFHQGEEALARRLASFVEEVATQVDGRLGAPGGRVRIILVDQTDASNGWATVFPYNLIEIAAAPPPSHSTIGNTDDWLRIVFAHEYTHIVHLEKSGGWIGGLGRVFGRIPVFRPNAFLPTWQIEGVATFEESAVTGQGRVPAGDFRFLLDEAAAADRFLSFDRAGDGLVDWPSGNAAYVYGAYFHDYLARQYGTAALERLAEATARSLPFLGSRSFRPIFGRSLGTLWKDFEADTESRLTPATGVTRATRLTRHGFVVTAPAFSRDGRLFYSVVNPHGFPAIMELPADGSAPRAVSTRYLGERIAVTGDLLVFNQLEVVHDTDLQSDLYAVPMNGGPTRRLTREARAADPDVAPDGHTVICTVQQTDRRLLAVLQLPSPGQTAGPVPLVTEAFTEFSAPRWSPDGRFIAAERRRLEGPSEIVIVDAATKAVRRLASSPRGRNVGPAWVPDGSHVLFSSDREGGPFQIYSVDLSSGAVRRLLGTGGSAQFPALSPDGHRLVFVGYSADGYDLQAVPFDAPEWGDVSQGAAVTGSDIRLPPSAAPSFGQKAPDSPYRPWPTLLPRYWVPVVETRRDAWLIGATTSGFDALGRHAYVATGSWDLSRNQPDWELAYSYTRWWPAFFANASDTIDDWREGTVRSRELRAGVAFPVRRVRWATTSLVAFDAAHDRFDCADCPLPTAASASRTSLQLGWNVSNAKSFGYSISAEQGGTMTLTSELTRGARSSHGNAGAITADLRGYLRLLPRHSVLAVRAAGAGTWGDPDLRRVFDAGGPGPQSTGFDFGSHAIGLLRGFSGSDIFGYNAAVGNIDYRFPLGWPQKGAGTVPLMVRNLHGALFADVGHAWDTSLHAADLRRSFGAELSTDTVLGETFPFTFTAGAAWRQDPSGRQQGWAGFARIGRAF